MLRNPEEPALLAGIEAGGTKFVLAVGHAPEAITARHAIPTRLPAETLAEAAQWFESQGPIAALGLAAFGPIELDPRSPDWGRIGRTPKPGWSGCDLAGFFAKRFAIPVGLDTDVNAAALAEQAVGAGKGANALAYVTVGTGIGGGLVIDGKAVHGAAHPEMGHIYPRRPEGDSDFAGYCPYHGDCLEGLASGPAIIARWGASLSELPADHAAHGLIARYLAELCHTVFATTAARVLVLGGGVMETPGLIERVAATAMALDRGYLPGRDRRTIVRPGLEGNSGIVGALMLAQRCLAVA